MGLPPSSAATQLITIEVSSASSFTGPTATVGTEAGTKVFLMEYGLYPANVYARILYCTSSFVEIVWENWRVLISVVPIDIH